MRGISLGLSLFFIAAGAILAWAVTAEPSGIDLKITGYIVFGIGCFGVLIWLTNWVVASRRQPPAPTQY